MEAKATVKTGHTGLQQCSWLAMCVLGKVPNHLSTHVTAVPGAGPLHSPHPSRYIPTHSNVPSPGETALKGEKDLLSQSPILADQANKGKVSLPSSLLKELLTNTHLSPHPMNRGETLPASVPSADTSGSLRRLIPTTRVLPGAALPPLPPLCKQNQNNCLTNQPLPSLMSPIPRYQVVIGQFSLLPSPCSESRLGEL